MEVRIKIICMKVIIKQKIFWWEWERKKESVREREWERKRERQSMLMKRKKWEKGCLRGSNSVFVLARELNALKALGKLNWTVILGHPRVPGTYNTYSVYFKSRITIAWNVTWRKQDLANRGCRQGCWCYVTSMYEISCGLRTSGYYTSKASRVTRLDQCRFVWVDNKA